jgi:predicted transcriptional regulator
MKSNTPATEGVEAAEKVGPLSLKLTPTTRQRLRNLAEIQRRPAHALAREAVEAYIEAQEEEIRRDQEAQASWRHYQDTGFHVTGEEAIAWIKSWGTPNELPKPVCHV